MKGDEIATIGGNAFVYILTAIQENPVLQTINVILAITTSVVILAYRIWAWWRSAHADGKIDKKELKEGIDIIKDGIEDIQEASKKKGDKKDEK